MSTQVATLKDVDRAYHSPLHSVATESPPRLRPPQRPLFLCSAGGRVLGGVLDPGSIYDAFVDFRGAMDALDAAGADVLLDLSLKGDLSYYSHAWAEGRGRTPPAVPTLRPRADAARRMLAARADLARRGAALREL